MMKGCLKFVWLCLWISLLAGCIRDEIEPCPPLQIHLAVKDKNYFNVDKVQGLEERLDENLPFRDYVPNLYYQLRDAVTGDVLEEQEIPQIDTDEQEFSFSYCCLPHGKYIVTVWGGMKSLDVLDASKHTLTFHPHHTQGDDVYMVCDTVVYDAYTSEHTLQMERTKGKLIVQMLGLPDSVNASSFTTDHLWGQVNRAWEYTGQTEVEHKAVFGSQADIVEKILLSPSVAADATVLKTDFFHQESTGMTPVHHVPGVNITMRRNELTVVRYVYDELQDVFLIYVLVNDNWEQVHKMEIE